jgi:hypothetical protein
MGGSVPASPKSPPWRKALQPPEITTKSSVVRKRVAPPACGDVRKINGVVVG